MYRICLAICIRSSNENVTLNPPLENSRCLYFVSILAPRQSTIIYKIGLSIDSINTTCCSTSFVSISSTMSTPLVLRCLISMDISRTISLVEAKFSTFKVIPMQRSSLICRVDMRLEWNGLVCLVMPLLGCLSIWG